MPAWTVCDACGAVIADDDRHADWHTRHDTKES